MQAQAHTIYPNKKEQSINAKQDTKRTAYRPGNDQRKEADSKENAAVRYKLFQPIRPKNVD